jgi:hypothetical protein
MVDFGSECVNFGTILNGFGDIGVLNPHKCILVNCTSHLMKSVKHHTTLNNLYIFRQKGGYVNLF